jgi:hypothetical protein
VVHDTNLQRITKGNADLLAGKDLVVAFQKAVLSSENPENMSSNTAADARPARIRRAAV